VIMGYHITQARAEAYVRTHPDQNLEVRPNPPQAHHDADTAEWGVWDLDAGRFIWIML
jgi:hypothetical protein